MNIEIDIESLEERLDKLEKLVTYLIKIERNNLPLKHTSECVEASKEATLKYGWEINSCECNSNLVNDNTSIKHVPVLSIEEVKSLLKQYKLNNKLNKKR